MIGNKKLLAIIPARGGSERLPRKNILNLSGKPLISWTIEAALNSKYIDRVIVSTDDDEIASISQKCGAEVPFKRPERLARDESTSIDVVLNVLSELKASNEIYDYVILLQPTSPYRDVNHIDDAIDMLVFKKANAIISTTKSKKSPLWMNTIPKNGDMSSFIKTNYQNKSSQELPIYFQLNGAIYLCRVKNLIEEETFFLKNNIFTYIMDIESSVDIDDQYDFLYAESISLLK
jgi:CMP-N-acetylneuraminic acid synthetase